MLSVMWKATRPESELDFIRSKMAAAFSDDFGSEWREDELYYEVIDDEHFEKGAYDPIIRATISFVAVCNINYCEAEVYTYWYENFLKNKLRVDDVFIEFKYTSNDWTTWRPTVY